MKLTTPSFESVLIVRKVISFVKFINWILTDEKKTTPSFLGVVEVLVKIAFFSPR
jgi:hypothetical protein